MRLSESLRRGIMESSVGGIVNKFRFKKRRTVLFFEDILANYVKMCDDAGYGNQMRKIGERWGLLGTKQLGTLNVFHSIKLLNYVVKSVWVNIGLITDCTLIKQDNIIVIETKNEFVTRVIGKNEFMVGFFKGCLFSYFGRKIEFLSSNGDKHRIRYEFKIMSNTFVSKTKNKELYDKLNEPQIRSGFTLKNALRSKILILKDKNRIYFRKRSIIPVENTVFHIIGNEAVLVERVPEISYAFFKGIIDEKTPSEKKLVLLKTILQVMGWSTITCFRKANEITVKLSHLPVGLQAEKDNWTFITNVIVGYVRVVDKKLTVEKIMQRNAGVTILFNRRSENYGS